MDVVVVQLRVSVTKLTVYSLCIKKMVTLRRPSFCRVGPAQYKRYIILHKRTPRLYITLNNNTQRKLYSSSPETKQNCVGIWQTRQKRNLINSLIVCVCRAILMHFRFSFFFFLSFSCRCLGWFSSPFLVVVVVGFPLLFLLSLLLFFVDHVLFHNDDAFIAVAIDNATTLLLLLLLLLMLLLLLLLLLPLLDIVVVVVVVACVHRH